MVVQRWLDNVACRIESSKCFVEKRKESSRSVSSMEEMSKELMDVAALIFSFSVQCFETVQHAFDEASKDTRGVG